MAAVLPIEIDQGTVWRRLVRLRTGTTESNQPLDLNGYQLHAQVRELWSAPAFKGLAIENLDQAAGSFELALDDRQRELRRPDLLWDLLAVAPDGSVAKYLEGPVKVHFTVTRLP